MQNFIKVTAVVCGLFFVQFHAVAQVTGWYYGSTDGTESTDLSLGRNGSGASFKMFSSDPGGSSYFRMHARRWGAGYTWSRESDGGIDKKIAYMYGSSSGQYFQLFHKDQSVKFQFHSNGYSYLNGGKVGIGITTPSHQLSVGVANTAIASWASTIVEAGLAVANQDNGTATYLYNQSENGIHGLNAYHYGIGQYIPLYLGWGGNDVYMAKDGGKVGIGTTSPTSPLHVKSNVNRTLALDFNGTSSGSYTWQSLNTNSVEQWRIVGRNSDSANLEFWNKTSDQVLTLLQNGNVGLGTNSPIARLDVRLDGKSGVMATLLSDEGISDATEVHRWTIRTGRSFDYPNRTLDFGMVSNSYGQNPAFYVAPKGVERFRITEDGNVGIGTDTPASKLAVVGTIRATEVKIMADVNTVPDFVFKEDYDLATLEETEAYIEANGHLESIPSASEVGENGLDLGAMNLKLLQKVEELTLHLIEQNKQLKTQAEKISVLEEQVSRLNK